MTGRREPRNCQDQSRVEEAGGDARRQCLLGAATRFQLNWQYEPSGGRLRVSPKTWRAGQRQTKSRRRALCEKSSLDHSEGATPTRLVKEMKNHVRQETDALAEISTAILIGRRVERPIDKHRASDYVLLGNKSPVAAIEADVAVVAHSEITVFRNDNIATLDMGAH